MTRYRMSDNTIVDTKNATAEWDEMRRSDGSNMIGCSSGSQWLDQSLYRSRKGRYYTVTYSRIQGRPDHAEWISNEEAARWFLLNNIELPANLAKLESEVSE